VRPGRYSSCRKLDNVGDAAKLGKASSRIAKAGSKADDVAASCRANSFVPGTEVLMADGSTKPIEQVEVGDWVWAANPETGEQGPRQVTDLIVGDGDIDLVDIVIDDDLVTATGRHPFWVDDQGRWVDAEDLASGDLLLLADGSTVEVERVSQRSAVQRVHNLTVDGIHTYFLVAGDDEVLVHNCGVGQHLTTSGDTVLGHEGWVERAKSVGASYFSIDRSAWDTMSEAERWTANRKFLDTIASRGDRVRLSVPSGSIRPSSTLAKEIDYLINQHGYVWKNQWALRPGG
jgi:hypothetical protein